MPLIKPSQADLHQAAGKTIPDVIGPNLRVLFCGINPGLYSGFTGHHFARPGNRFWPTLFAAGFTDRLLAPTEQARLLEYGCGITNLVARATAQADELTEAELIAGAKGLERKVKRFRPQVVAILGVSAYRQAFRLPQAQLGVQPTVFGPSRIWVLPNPSGLNAHYPPARLKELFQELRHAVWTKRAGNRAA